MKIKKDNVNHKPSQGDIYKDRIDGQPIIVIENKCCLVTSLAEDGCLLEKDVEVFKGRYDFVTKSSLIDNIGRNLKQNYWDELKEEK